MGQIYEGDDFTVVPRPTVINSFDFIRKEIKEFAIEMEKEMIKKDKQYKAKDITKYSFKFLIDILKEKRKEVDFEIDTTAERDKILSFEVNTELIHEAILCMLLRNKIKKKGGFITD